MTVFKGKNELDQGSVTMALFAGNEGFSITSIIDEIF